MSIYTTVQQASDIIINFVFCCGPLDNTLRLQARLPEIEQLTTQLNANTEELSDVRFQLEEDKATASAGMVRTHLNILITSHLVATSSCMISLT